LADLIIAPLEKDLFYFEDNSFWDI
jgi:hypothetical protein